MQNDCFDGQTTNLQKSQILGVAEGWGKTIIFYAVFDMRNTTNSVNTLAIAILLNGKMIAKFLVLPMRKLKSLNLKLNHQPLTLRLTLKVYW